MVRDSAVFDPVLLAVMANRVDAAVREMTSTVVLTACSSVIGMARDFSCSVLTADHQILSAAEGIPAHVFGGNLQAAKLVEMHPDLKEGDAFLNNDPYSGNSHPADHTFLVPVFHEGVHIFTTALSADAIEPLMIREPARPDAPADGGIESESTPRTNP